MTSHTARVRVAAINAYRKGSVRRLFESDAAQHIVSAKDENAQDRTAASSPSGRAAPIDPLDLPHGIESVSKPFSRELTFHVSDPPWEQYPAGLVTKTLMRSLSQAAAEHGMPIFGMSPVVDNLWDEPVLVRHTEHGKARRLQPGESPKIFSGLPGVIDVDLTWPDRSEVAHSLAQGFVELRDDPIQPLDLYGFNAPSDALAERWTPEEYLARGLHADDLKDRLAEVIGASDDSGPVVRWFSDLAVRMSDVAYEAGCPYVVNGIATHISGLQGSSFPHRNKLTDDGYAPVFIDGLCGYYSPKETAHYVIDLLLTWYGYRAGSPAGQRIAEQIHLAIAERFTPQAPEE